MNRTRGGYLHPAKLMEADALGLARDPNDVSVLRLQAGSGWDYARLPIDLENWHVQNDFADPGDVDVTDRWTKDNRAIGVGEVDLALSEPSTGRNVTGWPPRAEMSTANVTGDYIAYQAQYEGVMFTEEGHTGNAAGLEEYWMSHVEFGTIWGLHPSWDVPGLNKTFIGWQQEITNPGIGEPFNYQNGFGWILENGDLRFEVRRNGEPTAYASCNRTLYGDAVTDVGSGTLLKLDMAWFPGINEIRIRVAKQDATGLSEYVEPPVFMLDENFMPAGIHLKTTIGILATVGINAGLQARYYKFMVPKSGSA